MKYLGIDYGKRKVGLAISEGVSTSPLKVIESSGLLDALQKVKHIIDQERIEQVVIGMAESGESRGQTQKFVAELEKVVPVIVVEETLSSHFADVQMRDLGVRRSEIKSNDAVAAALILEEYLEKENSKK